MSQLTIRIIQLILGFMAVTGPLAIFLILLNMRERRESALCGIILKHLNSPNLRGLFSFKIRHGLLSGGDTVILDLWGCSSQRTWDTTRQLSLSLPPEVRLIVNAMVDDTHKVGFAMKVKRVVPFCPDFSCC